MNILKIKLSVLYNVPGDAAFLGLVTTGEVIRRGTFGVFDRAFSSAKTVFCGNLNIKNHI